MASSNPTKITLELKGFNELAGAFVGGMRTELFSDVADAMRTIAIKVRDTAKDIVITGRNYKKAPYDTGRLYKSIIMRIGGDPYSATVSPTVDYAVYPHEGLSTSKSYGRRPFMEDAVEESSSFTEQELTKALDASFGKVARKVN